MQIEYMYDPNEYIRSLSLIKKHISSKLPQSIKNNELVEQKIQKQINSNFIKYQKNSLINQRIKLSKEKRCAEQIKRKLTLEEIIKHKITISHTIRQNSTKQTIQRRKNERMIKQQVVKHKKHEIIKNKIKKTLQTMQKLQLNSDQQKANFIKLKVITDKIKSEEIQSQNIHKSRFLKTEIKSQSFLPQITARFYQNNQSKYFTTTEANQYKQQKVEYTSQQLIEKMSQKQKLKRSKSLLLNNNKSRINYLPSSRKNQKQNPEQIMEQLIQQKQLQGYQKWTQRNSISFKASSQLKHSQIKQAIHKYIKKFNLK